MSDNAPLIPQEEPESEEVGGGRKAAFKGGLWIAAAQLIPMVGTAALSVAIGRLLGPQDLGLQSYISYVEALFAAMVMWVVTTMSIKLLSEAQGAGDKEGFTRLKSLTFVANVGAGAFSAIGLSIIGLLSDNPLPWLIVSVTTLINGIVWGYGSVLVATDGWSAVASRRLWSQILAVTLGVALVFAGFGINGVFTANAVAAVVILIWMRIVTGPIPRAALLPLPVGWASMWGMLLLMEGLQQIVERKIELLFLQAYSDETQIAMYSIGFMVVSSAAVIPVSLVTAGLPAVARSLGAGTIQQTAEMLGHPLRIVMIASLPMTAGIVALGPPLVVAVYGEEYRQAAVLVPLMASSLVVITAGSLCTTFWIGASRMQIPLVSAVFAGVIDIALAFALVPRYGAWGAAWANLGGQIVMAALLLVMTWRAAGRFPFRWGRWTVGLLVSLVLLAVTSAVVWAVGIDTELSAALSVVAGGIVFAIITAAYGWFVGFLTPDDGVWMLNSLPGPLRKLGRFLVGPQARAEIAG